MLARTPLALLETVSPPSLNTSEEEPFGLNDYQEPHEYRIYGTDDAESYAVVDEHVYAWASQWKWKPKYSKRSSCVYLIRATKPAGWRDKQGNECWNITLSLHIEILKKFGPPPPSPKHCLADHRDRRPFNCLLSNLRWATFEENMANRLLATGSRRPYSPEDNKAFEEVLCGYR